MHPDVIYSNCKVSLNEVMHHKKCNAHDLHTYMHAHLIIKIMYVVCSRNSTSKCEVYIYTSAHTHARTHTHTHTHTTSKTICE